jgi:hypothetical protein
VSHSSVNSLPSTPESVEKKARELVRLAIEHLDSYASARSPEDLHETFSCIDQALSELPKTNPLRRYLLGNLSILLRERHPSASSEPIVRKSIEMLDELISLELPGTEPYLSALTNLGNAYRQLHTLTHDFRHLEESIRSHEKAVIEAQVDYPDRQAFLANYGNALRQRFEAKGDPRDLDKAIEAQTAAVGLEPPSEDAACLFHLTLGVSLFARYGVTAQKDDLDASIAHFRTSISLTPPSIPDLPSRLLRLVFALIRDFETNLEGPSLTEAINILDSIGLGDLSPDTRLSYLNARSITYRLRHEQTGSIHDLEQAIHAMRQCLPPLDQARTEHRGDLADLSLMLDELDMQTGRQSYLSEAEQLLLKAIDLSEDDPTFAARCHHNLANMMTSTYEEDGSLQSLVHAIRHRETAIALTPEGSKELALRVAALAQDHQSLAESNQDAAQLQTAIEEMRSAGSMPTQTRLDRALILHGLSLALAKYSELTHSPSASLEALDAARTATALAAPTSTASELRCATQWAYLAAYQRDWDEAARAFRQALTAHDALFEVQATPSHKARRLHNVADLHPYAAYAFAKVGESDLAVLALEKGRARLLADTLALSTDDLADLAAADPQLAATIAQAGNHLRSLQAQLPMALHAGDPLALEQEVTAASSHLRALVARVRSIPGFENFRSAGSIEEIRRAAALKPIVYVAASYPGGVSVLLHKTFPPQILFLPELSLSGLHGCLARASIHFYATGDLLGSIDQVCRWLWDILMGPVTDYLLTQGLDECVLIPSGLLGILPLHAAWTPAANTKTGRLYALDRVAIAYSPSARPLLATAAARNLPFTSVLVVEDPTCDLVHAHEESAAVLSHFSDRDLLGGLSATRQGVLSKVSRSNVVHFACHASAVASDPLASALIMAGNEPLTVEDIAQLTLPNTRLVVLSACETGLIGRELLDESIGFPSTFLGLGVPAVVSTIWEIDDESTAILMRSFYDNLLARSLPPHQALREAQIALRDHTLETRNFSHPYFWASFFVTGL